MQDRPWIQTAVFLLVLGVFSMPLMARDFSSVRNSTHPMVPSFRMKLEKQLGLTPEQRDAVRGLLNEQREQMNVLRKETAPKYQTVRNETDQKIRALLNPDQQTKFDSFIAQQKKEHEQRRKALDN